MTPPAAPAPPTVPDRAALAEFRRRARWRASASRLTVALAVLTLLPVLRPRRWQPLGLLHDEFPGLLAETARTSLLLVAIGLLLLSRGLRRGHRLAWLGTAGVLVLSAVLHLVHRLDVVAALVVLAGTGLLLAQRRSFPVLPNRQTVRRAALLAGTFAGVAVAVTVAVALLRGDGPGIERARLVGEGMESVLLVAFVATLGWTLTTPHAPRRQGQADHLADRERARGVVTRHGGGTLDYFALRDDKDWFFVGGSVVAHSVRSGVCLVSPDPIGPPAERTEAWAEFLRYANELGWSVCVIGASAQWRSIYEASGLRIVYLGDEAVVDCSAFSLAGGERKSLRQAVGRVARGGWTTTFHDPTTLPEVDREQIGQMAGESRRGEAERGFSMTLSRMFDPHDTGLLLSVTRNADGRVDAFCHWTPAADISGWSLDVMRRRLDVDDLPNGLIDATIVATIDEVVRRGERGLGLNFAVMRERLATEPQTRVDELVQPVLQRLSRGTQMASLSAFNEKFGPSWIPRYLVLDAAEFVATQAVAVAGAEGVTELPIIGRFLGRGDGS